MEDRSSISTDYGTTSCRYDGYFYELQATAPTYGDGLSQPFSATGPILWFGTSPTSSTGGVAFPQQPAVQSLNGDGSVNTGDGTTAVTLAITPGSGATGASLSCTGGDGMTVTTGTASFSGCAIDKASATNYSLTAAGLQGVVHAWPATSSTFKISAGPTARFGVSGLASPSTAGASQNVTVTPEDAGGNPAASPYGGAVYISFGPAVSGTSTPSSVAAGGCATSCTFNVQLTKAGTDTVTAGNAASSPTITGTQTVPVNPAPASAFLVGAPGSATAGTPFNITVTAIDPYGNTATAYGGTVHFTSSDGAASLPADSTLSNGAGTFGVTLNTTGEQTVSATDAVQSSISGSSGNIQVTPGAPDHIVIAPKSQTITAGTTYAFSVTAYDAANNQIGDVTSQTSFTISPDGQCVGGTGAGGAAPGNNSCGSTTSGPHTVTASYQGKTDTAALTINPGNATRLQVTAPGSTSAGSQFSFTVTAVDGFGNTATAYAGTVTFSSSDPAALLPADSTLSGGSGTFPATLNTAGTQTITATDTVQSGITGTTPGILVNPGPVSGFDVAAPSRATAGSPFDISVTAVDNQGNTVTGYSGTVHFTSTDGSATLPADSTLSSGSGTFPVTLRTAGDQFVSATDTVDGSVRGTSGSITVSPAALSSIAISPTNAVTSPGSAVSYTATALDAYGNAIGNVTSSTGFSISPGGACKQTDGSTATPGNNLCGAGSYGGYTVTARYSGLTASTGLTEDPGWARLPGSARDVGAWNTSLWVIGTNATGGGYGIYRYSNGGWIAYPGGASRIAVGPSGRPVAVNSGNSIYQWDGSGWQPLPGSAQDVAVGGTSADSIYVIGTNIVGGDGYGIWHYANGGWTSLPGAGVRIAVGPDGNPDVINASGAIYHWTGGGWQQLPGSAMDIGVGANGALWVIGVNAVPGGDGIYQWTGSGFAAVPGGGAEISVGSGGLPVIVNNTNDIYQRL